MTHQTRIQTFESPEEFADYAGTQAIVDSYDNYSGGWAGETIASGVKSLKEGDTTNLEAAQKILDQMDTQGIVSEFMPTLQSSVVGYFPDVSAYIQGLPQQMITLEYDEVPSPTSPLNVYVETSVSEGVSKDTLLKRGIAVLAFVLAMEAIRPVNLYVVCPMMPRGEGKDITACPIVKVASRPMDLGRAVFMLTSVTFARRMMFSAVYKMAEFSHWTGNIGWMYGSNPNAKDYEIRFRKLVGMQPTDVFLKGGYLFDDLMMKNPVAWVKSMIEKHRHEQYVGAGE